jgi:hypothetical protein
LECIVCNWNVLFAIGMYCGQLEYIVCVFKWPIFWEIWPIFRLKRPGFGWLNYQWMRPNYQWIQPNYRRMRPNFGFSEDYCFFHTSNTFRPNFSEFHRIFQKSTGSTISYFFCSARIFKHYKCSGFIKEMNEPGLWILTFGPLIQFSPCFATVHMFRSVASVLRCQTKEDTNRSHFFY